MAHFQVPPTPSTCHEHGHSRSVVGDDSRLFFARILSGSSACEGYETRLGENAQASACWVRLNREGRFAVVPRS